MRYVKINLFFRAECQTYLNSATEAGEVTTGNSGRSPYSHPHEPALPPKDQSHPAYQPLQITTQPVHGPYETIRHTDKESSSSKNQSTGHHNSPGNKHAAPQKCIYENI